ncbi:helicase SRCAP-like isoform X2 [Mya arenaria]|uniref:helicase SRCAP-like isoform X2 n=1 Tax=Mya arenaria TaxID=6604 RepID=UPI0022E72772|nr:helicase SRCAP-like isoform X2 [Mya arenaria]
MTSAGSSRKRIKLEEVPASDDETAIKRKRILSEKLSQLLEVKESYYDNLTECFFLQNGGQMMDYYPWRKKPTPQLVAFLKSGRLDSDDEDDNPVVYLKESKTTEDVKSSDSGSSCLLSTPDGSQTIKTQTTIPVSHTLNNPAAIVPAMVLTGTKAVSTSQSIHRSMSDTKLLTLGSNKTPTSVSGSEKTTSPGSQKQVSYDGTVIRGISSQEAIVERAKQATQVMSRVAELRKEGLWSTRRLPKVQEPPRPKTHWDYLLEEMQWLAADFHQERKWKKTCSKKIAKMVQKHFQDIEQRELKAEKEEGMRLKRIASQMAKMVKEFWTNIEKVVQYKQNSRLDEKRKKAMDLHLNFIVNQTEQYSTWLSEGLTQASNSGSRNTTPDPSVAGDDEFRPDDSESDDEETIEKDEQGINEEDTMDEVAALQKESELPIESLIESLPKEILENPASIPSDSEHEEEQTTVKDKDEEFDGKEESESDVEETIEEQEEQEEKDYDAELDDLKNEGDLDIEALRAKYSAAYDDDFEMPRDSDEESTDINASEDESEEEEEETEKEEEEADEEEDVGLEALVPEKQPKKEGEDVVGQELSDIAAEAASLQPKGYTLQTTEVKTPIPFLIKHSLREYQHVGLDWLATMYEKRLNGILADEMGLGKTIQTIALLAHLACEKGIWGPHLIVVPTSVMLNWEMECKKWCPAFKILTYYGSQKERKQKRTGWTKTNAFHICITSYKLVIQDHNAFRRKKWKYLILDEAQNIKNFKSQRWQCLLNFNSMRRLLLTGTPLQNSLMELWSLMHFLMPHVFQSHKDFKEWFANPLTGMIEGSHEYNENLIRRLHKVLRPFLLRRLKDDVEKQMPKKYEHVVMCHLSKRQRFLYDEFMAQGKTKETLASGHFMSVINILMQLRKVCNHPSLFDPRPIISPLQMEGLVYNTASLVLHVIKYNPLKDLDLHRYPGLAEMERDLPAFIAHRVRKLQTNRRLIEEIEVQPSPPPRPLPGKLKVNAIRSVSPAVQAGQSSPALGSRSASPAPLVKPATTASAQAPLQPAANTQNSASSAVPSSQPITVQIQHTDQGTRLVLPSSQISQLPGFIQLVQTSAGSSVPTSINISTTALVNGSPVVTMASSGGKPMVSSVMSQVKMSSGIQGGAQNPVQLPMGTGNQGQKPVMRVSPLTGQHMGSDGMVFTTASTTSSTSYVISGAGKPLSSVTPSLQMIKHLEAKKKRCSQQDFFMEPLFDKKQKAKQEKLKYISRTNKNHCEKKPVYGQDLCDAVNIFKDPYSSKSYRNRDLTKWQGPGHIHCYCAKNCDQPKHPKYLWNQTSVLSDFIHTPEQYLEELQDVLERFVFATPPLQCPPITMHTSHPPPSYLSREAARDALIRSELSPRTVNYHKISTKMTVQFPELRLIQYDCGKLQTLDILLHRLKSGDHRVLIFTQMTRMLDILEAFLNYHGHRYLRLDGTTKIEARQHLMDRFNADSRIFVFILSTRSGGVGVNLTGADTVIFYDSDWNPTMDAQAQDRCHRIGQTRDVHIYRLVSERTVEENILKKANQKRMLGDMAIEGGNFTTAFFKQNTISELFTEPSGLDSLVKEKEEEEKEKQDRTSRAQRRQEQKKSDPTEQVALQQFEKALANTEDETDRVAIDHVKDEQKEELAEFDENIPWEEGDRKGEDESHVEVELAMLDKELTPIERYAVQYTEQMMEPVNEEELKIAEEDIETVKKDWELNRLKALKEEEERRAEMEEDEMLYTYSRDDAYQQVFLSDLDHEQMPMWSPPTPPHDDNDVYMDQTLYFLYEPTVMPESQLPPVYIRKERKKIKVEAITTRKQKQKREEQPRVPRSLFDRANAQLQRLRRDAKLQKMKMGNLKQYRPAIPTLPPRQPVMEQTADHPEWLIHEDWALLQAVQSYFDVPLNLMIVNPAHTPNWDLVADVVNSCSRVYRSPKQCRLRYESVIIPREEGRIMYDMTPRKQKKQKGIYKVSKGNRAMKTGQIYSQDNNNGLTILYSLRFDSTKSIATKRPPTMRQTLVNPTMKNPKHASVLQENNIQYEQPLNPMQVAEIRAQRIQREKKENQTKQAAAAAAAASDQTTAVAGTQRVVQQGVLTVSQGQATPTIVAMSTAVTAAQLATICTSAGNAATVLTVTGTPLAQATLRGRVQEIPGTNVVGQVGAGVSQVRAHLPTSVTAVTTSLTQIQLAQRITAATTLASGATVQQQLQATGKTLTPAQFQVLQQQQHHQTLLRQQKQQNPALLQQQQLRTMQKQPTVIDPRQQQQQFRPNKGMLIQGQKTVIAQQLVTSSIAQLLPFQGHQLKAAVAGGVPMTRPVSLEDLNRLKQQQQLNQQKLAAGTSIAQLHHNTGQLQSTQIIAGTQLQQVSQGHAKLTGPQTGATLVKTVTAPAGSVTIPVSNVSINVSMPPKAGVSRQINPQTALLQQQRKQIAGQKGPAQRGPMLNAVQIIQQQGRSLTVQQLQQLVKQQSQGATIQQIIHTSQPTIIATVTQSQATPQMVTKVIATTATIQPTQFQQTMPASCFAVAVSGSPTVTSVPVSSSQLASLTQGQTSLTAVVKPGSGSGGADAVTTVQIHPISSLSQSKLTGMAQNVVVTPIQHVTATHTGTVQAHVPAASQVVVSASPMASQTLQVTVPATSLVQTQHGVPHVTVQGHRAVSATNNPVTVTLTPTAPGGSSQVQGSPVTYTATALSHGGGTPTQTPAEVTILQRQPSGQQTVQIQHTPSQTGAQTIHIQSQQSAGQAASPQTSQAKATYSMRTRNQSKPQ